MLIILTVNELFSGIGSQRKALERLGVQHEVVGISEIDKFAVKSYESIFGNTYNYGDISAVEKLKYADFWTYSFPCTDISVAGKQAGINENTRSGLLYQVERLLNISKLHNELPKYLMLENVKNLVGKKFKPQFDKWLEFLDDLGYNNYWKVLNAKDYGIPQNRERVFVISIRKDIDDRKFEFPKPFDNDVRLKDLLEKEVDEKFYISDDKVGRFITKLNNKNALLYDCSQVKREKRSREYNDYAPTLTSRDYKDPRMINVNVVGKINSSQDGAIVCPNGISPTHTAGHGNCPKIIEEKGLMQVGTLKGCGMPYDRMHDQSGRVYNPNGICPTVHTCGGGNLEPKILETPCVVAQRGRYTENNEIEQQFEINNTGNTNTITTVQKDNYVIEEPQVLRPERTEYGKQIRKQYETGEIKEKRCNMTTLQPRTDGNSNTLTTVQKDNYLCEPNFRIRKLTPLECWRLMGFDDKDFESAKSVNSNSQLYKQAGNSIVVDVLYQIFKNLFNEHDGVITNTTSFFN